MLRISTERERKRRSNFFAFLIVVVVLTILAFYSAKGFCIAISGLDKTSDVPIFAMHSILQTLTGGPVGLYGIAWYLASITT